MGSFDDRLPYAKKYNIDSDSSSNQTSEASYNNYFHMMGGQYKSTFARAPRKSSSFVLKEKS